MEKTSTFDYEVISGGADDDIFTAANNNVTLIGGPGNDQLFSNTGVNNTTMEGGAGYNALVGNGANDTASYVDAPAGVTVDLNDYGPNDPYGTAYTDDYSIADTLIGIENVTGSAYDDSLTGDDVANVLQGGAGDDTLAGGGGADVFKYSFGLTEGGGGETFSFTDFFAANGGSVVGGEVADGTKQGQFSSLYTQWLESLGLNVLDLGQNSGPDGHPIVEGPAGTFGERESFTWTSGSGKKAVTHERWYSDTWSTGSGGGQDIVTSLDGFDKIFGFESGSDKLDFSDITQVQFETSFQVDNSTEDAAITIDGFNDWSVTLVGVDFVLTDAMFAV